MAEDPASVAIPVRHIFKCYVVKVIDGDTQDFGVDLVFPHFFGIHLHNKMRVRLLGVDTPERRDLEPWRAATLFSYEWLSANAADTVLEIVDVDSFGRILGYIYNQVTGENLSEKLVESGHGVYRDRMTQIMELKGD